MILRQSVTLVTMPMYCCKLVELLGIKFLASQAAVAGPCFCLDARGSPRVAHR